MKTFSTILSIIFLFVLLMALIFACVFAFDAAHAYANLLFGNLL